MIDSTRFVEVQDRLVDEVIIISPNCVKGYTTKRNLKEQFEKLKEVIGKVNE